MRFFSGTTREKWFLLISLSVLCTFFSSCATTMGDRFTSIDLDPYEHGQKFLVGVMTPQAIPKDTSLQERDLAFSGLMVSNLQEYGRYRLVEGERVDALLEAQSFQMSGLVDVETAQEVGRLLGVEALCLTAVERYGYTEDKTTAFIAWIDTQTVDLVVSSRLVAVATGEVLATADTSVTRGRKRWVAFGFLKLGGFIEKGDLFDEAMELAIQNLAAELSRKAPRK